MRPISGSVRAVLAVAATGVVLVTAGCSGSSASGSRKPSDGSVSAAAGPAADSSGTGTIEGALPRTSVGTAAGGSQPPAKDTVALSPARIVTATVALEVAHGRDVARATDAATQLATRAGGEVDSDERTTGDAPGATVVLRVPTAAVSATLHALGALGTVTSQRQSSKDVTAQVADVTSRVTSAQAAIARLRALYAGATRVSDVLAVEQELSSREADLEALQAQQRSLAGQTALATITLTVGLARPAPVHHAEQGGFLGGLRDGWTAFRHAASAVARGVGAAVPTLVLLVLLGGAAWLVVTRTRRRRTTPAAAEE